MIIDQLRKAIRPERLLDTAVQLINIPSPTRSASDAANCLEDILRNDGLEVERPLAGWPESPAVVTRLESGRPGPTLQYNGHLDTVHLPFAPARIEDGMLYGSGSADMKGGLAAAVEALRALRDTNLLPSGAILLTAHDLHEAPWGDGSQVRGLIEAGYVGDGVLLPEYLYDQLPIVARGQVIFEVEISRSGVPVHEVLGGIDCPSVIAAGSELVQRLRQLDEQLALKTHPQAGRESVFVGQMHAGEIFNQSPTSCQLSGTRRWLPGTNVEDVRQQLQAIFSEIEEPFGVQVNGQINTSGLSYEFSPDIPLVTSCQHAYHAATGSDLPLGTKPFADDGNQFVNLAGVPAITHGPDGRGAHTVNEEVAVDELMRVALVYALTAVEFCAV